jgi:hypothetical protein
LVPLSSTSYRCLLHPQALCYHGESLKAGVRLCRVKGQWLSLFFTMSLYTHNCTADWPIIS